MVGRMRVFETVVAIRDPGQGDAEGSQGDTEGRYVDGIAESRRNGSWLVGLQCFIRPEANSGIRSGEAGGSERVGNSRRAWREGLGDLRSRVRM